MLAETSDESHLFLPDSPAGLVQLVAWTSLVVEIALSSLNARINLFLALVVMLQGRDRLQTECSQWSEPQSRNWQEGTARLLDPFEVGIVLSMDMERKSR